MSLSFGIGGILALHDLAAIVRVILDGYVLPVQGLHGVVHWARVLENGLRIAEANGAGGVRPQHFQTIELRRPDSHRRRAAYETVLELLQSTPQSAPCTGIEPV